MTQVAVDVVVARKRRQLLIAQGLAAAVFIFYLLVSTVLLLLNAYQATQSRTTITDCVEVTGKCFKEGQQRAENGIERLIEANQLGDLETRRIVILSVACSKLPEVKNVEDVEECVNNQLEIEKNKN